MEKRYVIFLFILPSLSYADFCPNNFRIINAGDSIATVLQNCGNPSSQKTTSVPVEGPQEWDYFVQQTVASNSVYQTKGTLKMSIAFDAKGNAINISVNGIGVGGTGVCNNNYIKLGDTRDHIKNSCGIPYNINKQTIGPPQTDQITEYTYNTNPPKSITFKNGKLVGQ